ncbi:MAG: hypothetical protein ACK4SX_14075 [Alcanivoracaceae bacterium]
MLENEKNPLSALPGHDFTNPQIHQRSGFPDHQTDPLVHASVERYLRNVTFINLLH